MAYENGFDFITHCLKPHESFTLYVAGYKCVKNNQDGTSKSFNLTIKKL